MIERAVARADVVPDPEGDARWQAWQARGLALDRRRTALVQALTVGVTLALAAWLLAELAAM